MPSIDHSISVQDRSDLRRKVISSVLWLAIMQYAGQAISWGITLYVIKLLNPDDYGLMAKAYLCIGFLLMVSELGLAAAIVQKHLIERKQISDVFGFVLVLNGVLMVLLYLSAPAIAAFFGDLKLILIYRGLSPVFMIISLYIIPQSLVMRRMDFRSKSIIDVVSALAGSFLTLLLALGGKGVWALVWGVLVQQTSLAIGYNLKMRELILPSFSFRNVADLFAFGGYVSGSKILWYLYSNADLFIGGKYFSNRDMGIYSIAVNLACIPIDKFTPIVSQVALSAYSHIQRESESIQHNFLKSVRILSLIVFPVCWGIALIIPEVASLFGTKWLDIILPVQMLCSIMPFRALGTLFAPLLQGIGRPETQFINLLITSMLLIPLFLAGIGWGISGLCLAWAIGYAVAFVIMSIRSLKIITVKIMDFFSALAIPALSSLCMVTVLYCFKHMIRTQEINIVIGSICIGIVIYALAMKLMRPKVLTEVVLLIRGTRP